MGADKKHTLHQELKEKVDSLKRCTSWMGRTEDVKWVCEPNNINPCEDWVHVPPAFGGGGGTFSFIVRLDKRSKEQNPLAVNAEVKAFISGKI